LDVIAGMRAFRAIATQKTFAEAGRTLGISTAWVSKRLAQLEEHLGTQLVRRTTRRTSLTTEGRVYLERCTRLLDDLDEIERSISGIRAAPRGVLRVSAPMSFGLLRLSPLLPAFAKRYPDVEVDIAYGDRYVDLVEERIDVALRIGPGLDDSSLVVRRVAVGERLVVASPAYLRRNGTPRHPSDLARHRCLRYALHGSPSRWSFDGPSGRIDVDVRGSIQANNSLALRHAALGDEGVLLTPDFVVDADLRSKALRRVLSAWKPSGYTIFLLSTPSRFATPKARAFIDFVVETFARSSA
jgi:DNA-binding transcriptional LysR family regulator